MSRALSYLLILVGLIIIAAGTLEAGIVKVAKRYNVVDFYGGFSSPVGSYDGIGILDFYDETGRLRELDAGDVYDQSFHLGFSYGQVRNDRIYVGVGFRYTSISQMDEFTVGNQILSISPTPDFNQYDVGFDVNYHLTPVTRAVLSPYVGVGFRGGFTAMTSEGVEAEYEADLALAGNFGLEVKLWESAKKRSFITVASINSYELTVSGDRPRYFNFGFGLKYYFRP